MTGERAEKEAGYNFRLEGINIVNVPAGTFFKKSARVVGVAALFGKIRILLDSERRRWSLRGTRFVGDF